MMINNYNHILRFRNHQNVALLTSLLHCIIKIENKYKNYQMRIMNLTPAII